MSKELADRLEESKYQGHTDHALLDEAIAALRSEPVAWIPVGERLLEDVDGEVLSVTMNGYVQIITASTLRSIKRAADKCGKECNITHWMPLPAAPSRETDGICYKAIIQYDDRTDIVHGVMHETQHGYESREKDQRSEAVVTTAESRDSCKQSLFAPEQQSFDHPTAEPALSAEQQANFVESLSNWLMTRSISNWAREFGYSELMQNYATDLRAMALSSLTARDEFAKEKAALSQQWLDWGVKRRDEGIEAAAKVCDEWERKLSHGGGYAIKIVKEHIRALKGASHD